ncbi:MAG: oligosaccharide flippase family protein [Lachnospiraceae bacterium]
MSQETKNSILRQGTILAVAGIVVRVIGMFYRIPLANIVGDEGNGVYSVAFNVYNIALILSSYGLPMAVSKMVSGCLAKNEYGNTRRIFISSLIFACCTGGLACLVLFFGAGFLANHVYSGYAGIEMPLRVLAPTVFIVAILGVVRGFFQGFGNMVPTAVSQVIEQIVNAIVSIVAAMILVNAHLGAANIAGYGAMGGTFGTCFGAVAALATVIIYGIVSKAFMIRGSAFLKERKKTQGEIYRMILFTTIPIILGQTFYQISAVFDDILFGNIMNARGFTSEVISGSSGVYNSIYVLMISIPMGVASALASSALPSIVHSYAKDDVEEVKSKIHSVIKFDMMIAIPSSVGLFVIGEPVVRMIFPRLDYVTGGAMLRLGALAVVFYAISTVTSSILQALDKMNCPVIHSAISLVIHVAMVAGMLKFTDLGPYALVIGYMTFPVIVGILNMIQIRKTIDYHQEVCKTFLVTAGCALFMGICTYGTYEGVYALLQSNTLAVFAALAVAVVTYFGPMIAFKNVERP